MQRNKLLNSFLVIIRSKVIWALTVQTNDDNEARMVFALNSIKRKNANFFLLTN